MDEEELQKMLGAFDKNKPVEADPVLLEKLKYGTPTEVSIIAQQLGMNAGKTKIYVDLATEREARRQMSASLGSDADIGIGIIDTMLKDGSVDNLSGFSQNVVSGDGMISSALRSISDATLDLTGQTTYGTSIANLGQLMGMGFLSNVDKMQGMGSLSDAEGKAIKQAYSKLNSLLGGGKGVIEQETVEAELKRLRENFEKIKKRNAAGKRVDLSTGEEISMEEFNSRNPDLTVGPSNAPVEQTTENGGTDPYDYSKDTRSVDEIYKELETNIDSIPAGTVIKFPNGSSMTVVEE